MKINELYKGQVVKNYRELCKILNIKQTGGSAKKSQMKELARFVKYHKDGNKIIIDEIYKEPLEKINGRIEAIKLRAKNNSDWKIYDNLNIEPEKMLNYGIYKITLNNDIYIGSTIKSFRKRFQQHNRGKDKLMKHTYELLQNGGVFEILHDMTGIEDEELIRMVEDEAIKEYLLNPNWNIINRKPGAKSYNRTYKKKKKVIRIDEDKLYEAIQLLAKHGLIDEEGVDM